MEKLPMCRICLAENVHMYVVASETLHDLYEKITDIPFVTEDSRPILACYICCAQLKKCYRFRKKCLEAEEQFGKMMNEEYEKKPLINQDQFELFHGFIRTPVDTISIVDVDQTESIVVKDELPADWERIDDVIETNEEYESDDDMKTVNIYDNYLDIEVASLHYSESDLEDDVPLLEVKKEGQAEKTSGPAVVKKQETDTRGIKLTDIITTKQKEADPKIIQDNHNRPPVVKKQKYDRRTKLADKLTTKQNKVDQKMIQDNQNRRSKRYIARNQKVQIRISNFKQKEKPFKCDFCQRRFSLKCNLTKHFIRAHPDEKHFKCDVCQYSVREKAALKLHRQTHGENPFKCHICSHTFRFKSAFTQHIRKHTGEKPFQCDICECSFRLKTALRHHIRKHTGEKPFKCDICPDRFRYKGGLTQHKKKHTSDKPFQCDVCQNRFKALSSLRKHYEIHTGEKPYKCDICPSTFRCKSSLRRHIYRHTGEKPFQCHICQSCFSRRFTLTKHMKIHTGEKDFQCQICLCSFKQKAALTKHIFRTHADEKPS